MRAQTHAHTHQFTDVLRSREDGLAEVSPCKEVVGGRGLLEVVPEVLQCCVRAALLEPGIHTRNGSLGTINMCAHTVG